MPPTAPRPAAPVVPAVLALVVALLLALVGTGVVVGLDAPSASASSASESSGRPDPGLGREGCRLMDRVYVAGGCSRTQCRQAGEQIRYSPNAETCTIGGRLGTSYGSEIDSRVCAQLHRRFVAAVNFCAANPHRDEVLIFDAPQCVAPWTAYVTTSRTTATRATRAEAEGRYDVCVRPQEARRLQREAARTGRSLRGLAVSEATDVTQPGDGAPTVLVVGDSLTWRGTDELGSLRPTWDVDGASGRNLGELGDRITHYTDAHGAPTGLVIALGTNPARGFSLADLRRVVAQVPAETQVMVVLPYRRVVGATTRLQARAVARAAGILRELAATRPTTCVADWAALVSAHPSMLVDGTHQIRRVEGVWARFIASGWDTCTAQQATAPAPAPAPALAASRTAS